VNIMSFLRSASSCKKSFQVKQSKSRKVERLLSWI
jgi:hypothetical protein